MNTPTKTAIISGLGLGDGLMMMIVAYHLKKSNHNVTFYHPSLHELKHFFEGYKFKALSEESSFDIFFSYDLIIIEAHDHLSDKFIQNRDLLKKVYIIHPKNKCSNAHPLDLFCNKQKTLTENLALISCTLTNNFVEDNVLKDFFLKDILKYKTNGIIFPSFLSHRKYKKRIVIHPLSLSKTKNWRKKRFIKLYKKLKKEGFDPVFSLAPNELKDWKNEKVNIVTFKSLHDLACFIYESGYLIGNDSGPAHMASNFNIPTMVVASSAREMKLWKPDFHPTKLLLASKLIPNPKFLRIRDKYWSFFMSTRRVFKNFKTLITS